ncbi:hypothetical protein G3O00_36015 [Burkholderia sp. Ac-20384]|uniref:hypothetical protein n=1 Tax=Burkholderia sp. Ac-20384 TaxID=2703902 RepID=UPI00197DD204|nr:hypothetical protein [Burkholderia sp. Ac-20384]MBN3828971.1 hypothetical protein [Burkholderia sp. Ac-20384]
MTAAASILTRKMTQYEKAHVPRWLVLSLQSYAFLCGVKWIEEDGYRLHERVRQSDLKRLMRQQLRRNQKVIEEIPYKWIARREFQSERWRADLAVRLRRLNDEASVVHRTQFVFELKYQDADSEAFDRDLYKLARLHRAVRGRTWDCRTFLVVLGRGETHERFADIGRPGTFRSTETPTVRSTYVTRGIFTAAAVGCEHDAHYVCLVEVTD